MFRFIFPILIILASVAGFFAYTDPVYKEIKNLKLKQEAYSQALSNSAKLREKRDELAVKYNSISPESLDRLGKLLPDSINNIRLIVEIVPLAAKHSMILKGVKFAPAEKITQISTGENLITGRPAVQYTQTSSNTFNAQKEENKEYSTFDLEFSTESTYENFVGFLKDLEKSLRIMDINSIAFNSSDEKNFYKYDFKIKTYWLKN